MASSSLEALDEELGRLRKREEDLINQLYSGNCHDYFRLAHSKAKHIIIMPYKISIESELSVILLASCIYRGLLHKEVF